MAQTARDIILIDFARDLCTKTVEEIRASWKDQEIDALNRVHPGAFEARLVDHNPIYYLAQNVWFDNNPALLHAPLHRDRLCKEVLSYLTGDTDANKALSGLLVLVQRDSFKSTFMHGVVPMWYAIREKYVNGRDVRILLTHQREEQASGNLRKLKARCINSPFLKRMWSDPRWKFAAAEDFGTSLKFDWACKEQGRFHEPSVMAAGSGARLVGMHFDLKCDDDLVDDEQRTSKVVRDRAKGRYGASRFMLDTLGGKEIVSGTPYHINDLYSVLRNAKDENKTKLYRQLIVGSGGKHTDEPLSAPNRHTQEFLNKKLQEITETDGYDARYWCQYQCDPRSSTMIAAELEWINHIDLNDIPKNISCAVLVDPAWKGTKNAGTGCDAALAVVAFERVGFLMKTYMLDLIVSNEMTSLDGQNAIFDLMKQYGTTEVGVEEHNSWAFRTDLEQAANTRGKYVHLIDFKTKFTAKQERIATFLRRVQAGQFYISSACRNKEVFLSQYEDFPQVDKNDALDVMSYSADPNVAECFAPRFNTEAQGMEWEPYEPMRTRYGTI